MHDLLIGLLDLTWPERCLLCEASIPVQALCAECAALLLEPRGGARCRCCDRDLGSGGRPGSRCGRCLARPPAFERAFGVFDYEGPVGVAIRAAKYQGDARRMAWVASVLCDAVPGALLESPPALVVPVPLHPRRVRQRGLHAPLLLARSVARIWRVPCARRALRRTRDTPPQAGLMAPQRAANLRGALALQGKHAVAGLDVLLVDDVMTTGATAEAASRVLRRGGAERVRVLCAARVPLER